MDDDFTFGASIWASNEPVSALPPQKPSSAPGRQFGDDDGFDDFSDPVDATQASAGDDEFGDFGEADVTGPSGFRDDPGFEEDVRIAASSSSDWHALNLDPLPSRQDLDEQLQTILGPIWGYEDLANILKSDGIREVEGINQILVDSERCANMTALHL